MTKMAHEISYVGDYNRAAPADVKVVSRDQDYVGVCHALATHPAKTAALKIWARTRLHFNWLRHFADHAGVACTFREKTARVILAEEWCVTIPDWLDDDTVTSQRILDLQLPGQHPPSFQETMLVMLGPAFLASSLTPLAVGEVLSQLTGNEAVRRLARYPVLRRCLEDKCATWRTSSPPPWMTWLCQGMLDDPDRLCRELTLWALLAGYPPRLLEYVLSPQQCVAVKGVPLMAVANLALHPVAVEQATSQINLFFDGMGLKMKAEEFRKLIQCVSGRLQCEFDRLVAILEHDSFQASKDDVELLRNQFSDCAGLSRAKLASLERYIGVVPPSVADANGDWGAKEWIAWAVGQYLPYRQSQIRKEKADRQVEDSVCRFSDWYVREYAAIHQNAELSLVHVLNQWAEPIRQDALSVVLVVDCLPAVFWPRLQEALTQAGFHRHSMDYRFAPLPSDTTNAKPRLLAGSWSPDATGYPEIVKERVQSDWPTRKAVYLPDLKSLMVFIPPPEGALLFLNFLPTDELLHSDIESAGGTYDEELYKILARVSEAVRDLVNRWTGPADRMGVYVVTDHGACRILADEQAAFDSKLTSKLFGNEKHRFAYVSDIEAQAVPDNLWALGYRFKQPFAQEDGVYFIPRGHSTVKMSSSGSHFVHGGASPEEVIVPAAVFRPVKAAWKEPSVRFLDLRLDDDGKATFYVMRVTAIQIEMVNPNAEPISLSQVELLTPSGEVKQFSRTVIPAHSTGVVDVALYFQKSAQGKDEIALQLGYKLAGEEHNFSLNAGAGFKTATSGGFNLNDLK